MSFKKEIIVFFIGVVMLSLTAFSLTSDVCAETVSQREDIQIQRIVKAEERQAKALEGILKEMKEIRKVIK